jgi:hypothetical protein
MDWKKFLVLVIIFLPGIFWVFFEKVKINSVRLNYYGPKEIRGKGDTLFYQIPSFDGLSDSSATILLPLHLKYQKDQYHCQSLIETILYRAEKLKGIPVCFISNDSITISLYTKVSEHKKDTKYLLLSDSLFSKYVSAFYLNKPFYVFDYFALLTDKERHIRGYYNVQFADEVKRMIQEYQHLRLKEEAKSLKDAHTIEAR